MLLQNLKILNKFKIFEDHRIWKFSNIIDLKKLDFLSEEKISEHSRFVNKYVLQSWINNNNLMIIKWVLFDDFHSMLLQDLKTTWWEVLIDCLFILN